MNDIAHDINGSFYVAGQQGELEEELEHRYVWVLTGDLGTFGLGRTVDPAANGALAAITNVIKVNYWKLKALTGAHAVSDTEAMRIAYLRAHALVKGFGDTARNLNEHHVRYSDIKDCAATTTVTLPAVGNAAAEVKNVTDDVPGWDADQAWRRAATPKIMNMVCTVAFFMRTRGHHYLAEMEDRYVNVWRRCLMEEDNPGLAWEKVAHHTYHFIYPDTLDGLWANAVENSFCAGTLIKRFDCLPAGVAAVGAVAAGADDVALVFPALENRLPDSFTHLRACQAAIKKDRWTGSINRRFYNAPDLLVNERVLGPLAAVILAALNNSVSTSPLAKSPALKRVGDNAPISGSMLSQVLNKATQDDRMVDAMFIEDEGD